MEIIDSPRSANEKKLSFEKLHHFARKKRQNDSYNDITIQVENERIPGNKLMLACYSKFFESMFEAELKERYERTVKLQHCQSTPVTKLIEFIYSGALHIDNQNVMEVLATADYLQIDVAKNICFDHLVANIALDNWCNVLYAYDLYQNGLLWKEVCLFVGPNLRSVSPSKEFKDLSKNMLIAIIKDLNKGITDESAVFEAVMHWIKNDEDERKNNLVELLGLVDLYNLPSEFLEDIVANDPLVTENNFCLKDVTLCIKNRFKAMRLRDDGPRIVAIGGVYNSSSSRVTEVFKLSGQAKAEFSSIPTDFCHFKSHVMADSIYSVCRSRATNKVTVLKMDTGGSMEWKELATNEHKQEFMSTAIFNDRLVMVGGFSDELTGNTVTYDPVSDKWKQLEAQLNFPRFGHALVVCKGSLYALGGHDETNALQSVEKLDKFTSTWEITKPMNVSRVGFAATECQGCIYVSGGYDGSKNMNVLNTMEKYHPDEQKWTYIKPAMTIERYYHAACVMRGKLYIVGGWNQQNKPEQSVRSYCPTSNTWETADHIEQELVHHSLVVI